MICPHCHKAITYGVDGAVYRRAKKLKDEGFSLREMEKILFKEGINVSFSSLSRAFKGQIKKVKL